MFGNTQLIEEKIQSLNESTHQFEMALRTSLHSGEKDSHIAIQRINRMSQELKAKVRDVLNQRGQQTALRFKTESAVSSAQFYITKFEEALRLGIPFDGDILSKVGIAQSQYNKRGEK